MLIYLIAQYLSQECTDLEVSLSCFFVVTSGHVMELSYTAVDKKYTEKEVRKACIYGPLN